MVVREILVCCSGRMVRKSIAYLKSEPVNKVFDLLVHALHGILTMNSRRLALVLGDGHVMIDCTDCLCVSKGDVGLTQIGLYLWCDCRC